MAPGKKPKNYEIIIFSLLLFIMMYKLRTTRCWSTEIVENMDIS